MRDFIQEYGDAKRLAPSRANDILEAALGTEQPPPPDADVSYLQALRPLASTRKDANDSGMLRIVMLPLCARSLAGRGRCLEGCPRRHPFRRGACREKIWQEVNRALVDQYHSFYREHATEAARSCTMFRPAIDTSHIAATIKVVAMLDGPLYIDLIDVVECNLGDISQPKCLRTSHHDYQSRPFGTEPNHHECIYSNSSTRSGGHSPLASP